MRSILFVGLVVARLLLAACGRRADLRPQVVKETVEVVVTQEVEKQSSSPKR